MVQSVARETGLGQGELRGKEEGIAVHRKLDDADNRLNGDSIQHKSCLHKETIKKISNVHGISLFFLAAYKTKMLPRIEIISLV